MVQFPCLSTLTSEVIAMALLKPKTNPIKQAKESTSFAFGANVKSSKKGKAGSAHRSKGGGGSGGNYSGGSDSSTFK